MQASELQTVFSIRQTRKCLVKDAGPESIDLDSINYATIIVCTFCINAVRPLHGKI